MNYNKIQIAGNLTRDPEMRYTPKGSAIAKLGLAINRRWKSESGEAREETTFVDVDVFGRTAENCAQYLKKGSCAFVEGRLKLDQWDDKTTGQKRSKLGVVAESVQFIGGKASASESPARPAPSGARGGAATQPTETDDVPF